VSSPAPDGTLPPTRRTGLVVGGLLTAVGTVWVLQGLDVAFAPRSFMTDAREWVVIGAVTAAVGLAVVRWSWTRPR